MAFSDGTALAVATKVNDGNNNTWNTDVTGMSRCVLEAASVDTQQVENDEGDMVDQEVENAYWDTDKSGTSDEVKSAVYEIFLEDVTTNFAGRAAICFARNGKFFEAAFGTHFDSGIDAVPYQYLYICRRGGEACEIPTADLTEKSKPRAGITYLRAINFGRFGNFTISKFVSEYDTDGEYNSTRSKWIN